jgi:HTH-type transcriptional regulator / antitoxin HigA
MIGVNTNINSRQYGRLLSKAQPTIIRTEEENERALLLVEKLFAKGDDLTYEETALLELLVKLIADFEEEYYPIRDASPREVLVEIMSARGLKQKDLTEVFGSKSRASEAISGKREISKSQAKALAGFFNVSVELFI